MLSKITSSIKWLLAALVGLAGIFLAGRQSATKDMQAKIDREAREQERRANAALQAGLANEQKVRDEIRNNPGKRVDLD